MSYKLKYTGEQIDNILDRAVEGGTIDDELALKAPLESPALTGTPTAPTQAEGDGSTKVATTAYADRAADAAEAAAEAAAKEYTDAATGALYITDTASGSIASFSDGADGVAMRSVVVNITSVQSGSGDPSPDNVRPISGWTGAEPVRTGKNLLDSSIWELGSISAAGNNSAANDSMRTRIESLIPVEPNTTYTFSEKETSSEIWVTEYSGDKITVPRRKVVNNSRRGTFTTGENTTFIRLRVNCATAGVLNTETQLELGSTATAYEPYAGQTFPVTWESQAGEVFGGTIDVVSGELTVTHGYADLGTLNWSAGSNNRFASQDLSDAKDVNANSYANAICSYYQIRTRNQLNGDVIGFSIDTYSNINYLNVRDTAYTDAATFKTAMSGVQLVYELAQPVIYRLSAQQIASLYGQNNVWSNTGDVEVEYVADPKLYIAKMLGGGALTLGSVSPLSVNRPVTISEEDLEQAGEVSEAVEAATETVLPAESGETEEEAQE